MGIICTFWNASFQDKHWVSNRGLWSAWFQVSTVRPWGHTDPGHWWYAVWWWWQGSQSQRRPPVIVLRMMRVIQILSQVALIPAMMKEREVMLRKVMLRWRMVMKLGSWQSPCPHRNFLSSFQLCHRWPSVSLSRNGLVQVVHLAQVRHPGLQMELWTCNVTFFDESPHIWFLVSWLQNIFVLATSRSIRTVADDPITIDEELLPHVIIQVLLPPQDGIYSICHTISNKDPFDLELVRLSWLHTSEALQAWFGECLWALDLQDLQSSAPWSWEAGSHSMQPCLCGKTDGSGISITYTYSKTCFWWGLGSYLNSSRHMN